MIKNEKISVFFFVRRTFGHYREISSSPNYWLAPLPFSSHRFHSLLGLTWQRCRFGSKYIL